MFTSRSTSTPVAPEVSGLLNLPIPRTPMPPFVRWTELKSTALAWRLYSRRKVARALERCASPRIVTVEEAAVVIDTMIAEAVTDTATVVGAAADPTLAIDMSDAIEDIRATVQPSNTRSFCYSMIQ
jgi:hypothetical protein